MSVDRLQLLRNHLFLLMFCKLIAAIVSTQIEHDILLESQVSLLSSQRRTRAEEHNTSLFLTNVMRRQTPCGI